MGPLRFQPLFKDYVWGGDRLAGWGKDLPPELDRVAETWEIADHGDDQSVVRAGPWAGRTLGELVADEPAALLGAHHRPVDRFPLLLKLLDAHRTLSVQVHPSDAQAARQRPPDLGKTEAWVVLEAEPGATLHAGLRDGVDEAALRAALDAGTVADCLHPVEPEPGDVIFLPAGTVHALGEGLLVAELQQASDTTFRLFDWNRLGTDGRPRPLHVEQAMAVIDWARGPVEPTVPTPVGDGRACLVACDAFRLDRWALHRAAVLGGDDRCTVLLVIDGAVTLEGDPVGRPLSRGDAALIPAAAGAVGVSPHGEATVLLGLPGAS